jgi:MFS family permease
MELPAAVLGFTIAMLLMPRDPLSARRIKYDLAGTGLWILALASFTWLLAGQPPSSAEGRWIVSLALVFLFATLIMLERRSAEALFDLSCFRKGPFLASAVSLSIAFTSSYMLTFVLPFYLLEGRHQSPGATGRFLAAYALARGGAAWLSGRWSDGVDARRFTVSGLVMLTCGLATLSRVNESSPPSAIAAALLLAGLGFGCFVPSNNSLLMGSAHPERHGFAAGIMATARTVGMTVGVALAGAILSADSGTLVRRVGLAFSTAAAVALASAVTSAFTVRHFLPVLIIRALIFSSRKKTLQRSKGLVTK